MVQGNVGDGLMVLEAVGCPEAVDEALWYLTICVFSILYYLVKSRGLPTLKDKESAG